MSWNDGYERKKFEKKQAAQAEQYRLLGMNEAQIHAIYLFDLEEYRRNRIFAAHVQSIEGQERDGEESRNIFHRKHSIREDPPEADPSERGGTHGGERSTASCNFHEDPTFLCFDVAKSTRKNASCQALALHFG